MKTVIGFVLSLAVAQAAAAATTISLPARRVTISGEGTQAALYDLSAELKRQQVGNTKETGRLLQVDLKLRPTFTGATIALLVGGVAVDSATVESEQESSLSLGTDLQVTSAPWILAVRGDIQILELRVTVDVAAKAPDVIVPTTPANPSPIVNPTPAPAPKGELSPGQEVIAVSRTTGKIEPVQIVRLDSDGTYTISYDGDEYPGWGRDQLALMKGCASNGICVGQAVEWSDWAEAKDLRTIGLLPSGLLVVESPSANKRLVADSRSLRKKATPKTPPTQRPGKSTRWTVGKNVFFVEDNNRVHPAKITQIGKYGVVFQLQDNGEKYQAGIDTDRLAQTSGCAAQVCVGQQFITADLNGVSYSVTVVGLQSERFAVLQINGRGTKVGNWPISALRQ